MFLPLEISITRLSDCINVSNTYSCHVPCFVLLTGGTGMTYGKMKSQAGEPNWEVRERTTQHWKLQETSSKQNLSPKTLILINGSDLLWQDPVPTSPTVEHINATKTAAP